MNVRLSGGGGSGGLSARRLVRRTIDEPVPAVMRAAGRVVLTALLAGFGTALATCQFLLAPFDDYGFWVAAIAVLAALVGAFGSFAAYRRLAAQACRERNAAVALETRLAQYERVVDAAPAMLWATDRDGRIRYVNRRWSEFIEDDIGKSLDGVWMAAISASDAAKWRTCHEGAMRRTCVADIELQMRGRDGGMHWMAIRLASFVGEDGDIDGYVGSAIDVSQRKKDEQTLAASEERVRAIVATAVDPIITIDTMGIVESFNAAAVRTFGYAVDEIVGKNVNLLMPSPYAEEHDHYLRRYLSTGDRRVIGIGRELVGRRRDGSTFPIELTVSQWTVESKRRFTGVVRDITERKTAEDKAAALKDAADEAQAQLEEYAITVELANVEAKIARDQAEFANRTKSEFLANMSHEIRTPMTAILGYTDLLVEDLGATGSAGEWLRTIKRNGEHLLSLINDILDLSKIEAGKMTVEAVDCRPRELVREVQMLLNERAGDKGLSLEVDVAPNVPAIVRTDPTRLKQILFNLIGNAIKFTASGSVGATIAWIPETSDESAILDIVVRDTGIGMSEEQVSRLFQPFTQADSSTTRRFGGTGLGLTISRHLANLMGGDITIESQAGVGSTFRVTVAAAEIEDKSGKRGTTNATDGRGGGDAGAGTAVDTSAGSAADGAANGASAFNYRILLAEDGIDNQRLISLVLRKAGADVTIVENGQAAVEHALGQVEAQEGGSEREGRPFDVVLMDMQMPVCDGYEATRRLRAEGYDGPIIALTANAMSDDRQKCLDAGCSDYAAKPIDRAVLLATIARHAESQAASKGSMPV